MIDLNQAIRSQAMTWGPCVEILWRALAGAPVFLRREGIQKETNSLIFKDSRDGKRYAITIKEIT